MSISKPQKVNLIDTLSLGFAAVNRKLWVLLIPVLLNVYLWYGAQISFGPLINDIVNFLQQSQPAAQAQADLSLLYERWRMFGQQDVQQRLAVFNFVPTLTMYVVSSLSDGGGSMPFPEQVLPALDQQRAVIEVDGVAEALLLALAINSALLPISAAFLTLLAEIVRGDAGGAGRWLRQSGRAALRLLGLIGLIIGGALVIGVPFLILAGLLSLINGALGLFLILLLQIAVFWAGIYLTFAPEAIVVSGIGPVAAVRASFGIVRRNFWSTLVFLGIGLMITIGTGVIWRGLAGSDVGLVAAIIGSAYIGSGLLAARMAFYRERLRQWHMAVGS